MLATARQIQSELRHLGNPDSAKHAMGFFKTGKGEYGEGDLFLGVRVPVLRQLAAAHKDSELDVLRQILQSRYHEERQFALIALVNRFSKGKVKEQHAIYKLYMANRSKINNWDLVDCSASYIVGAFLQNRSRAPLYKLAKAKSLWDRRIAIIATHHLIKHQDFDDTLAISLQLLNDEEDLIHKAVGWMLREIGKLDGHRERAFLNKHYSKMPRTMLRYAIEHFPKAERQRYLKGLI